MHNKVLQTLHAAAVQLGYEDIDIYPDYSGRGMMGNKTDALTYTDLNTLTTTIAQAAFNLKDASEDLRNLFLSELCNASHDQLGRQRLLY